MHNNFTRIKQCERNVRARNYCLSKVREKIYCVFTSNRSVNGAKNPVELWSYIVYDSTRFRFFIPFSFSERQNFSLTAINHGRRNFCVCVCSSLHVNYYYNLTIFHRFYWCLISFNGRAPESLPAISCDLWPIRKRQDETQVHLTDEP